MHECFCCIFWPYYRVRSSALQALWTRPCGQKTQQIMFNFHCHLYCSITHNLSVCGVCTHALDVWCMIHICFVILEKLRDMRQVGRWENYEVASYLSSVVSTTVSQKSAHGRSTLQVCQRGGWVLFCVFPHFITKERLCHVYHDSMPL